MSIQPHVATRYWVLEGDFPTADSFKHYDLSAHFAEKQRLAEAEARETRLKQYPMYNDMFIAVCSGKVSEVRRMEELGGNLFSTDVVRRVAWWVVCPCPRVLTCKLCAYLTEWVDNVASCCKAWA